MSKQRSDPTYALINQFNILLFKKIYNNCIVLKNTLKYRPFIMSDIRQVLKIYNYHINNSFSNFEEKSISLKNFNKLCKDILNSKLPFVVCEKNEKILGFAYLNNFRNKSGYKFSFENSIYIDTQYIGIGIGSNLLKKIIYFANRNNKIKSIVAVIGSHDSKASIAIHKKHGFIMVGILKKIGFKNKKWLDSIYMQKIFK